MAALFDHVAQSAATGRDRPISELVPADGRWTGLLNAVMTYIAGAELDRMSTIDLDRYEDTELNWRLVEGYGAMIAASADKVATALESPVTRVDHSGRHIRIETPKGTIEADRAIVTLPSSIIGENEDLFFPALPHKTEAARGLPLGLDDKLFIALDNAEEFEVESRVFGRTDRAATGNYHFRPFGRPLIECYFAGRWAHELEAGGDDAFAANARFQNVVTIDQRGPGLADALLDDPFRQADIPRFSEAPESPPAAGRRRWNSCRRCGGHRLRHSPAAHSRRPFRATRRGSHNSRSLPR